jgi:hypothetical protein
MDVWICLGQHRACVRVSTVPLPSAESECSLTAATPQNSLNLTRLVFCAQPLLPLCTAALALIIIPDLHLGLDSLIRVLFRPGTQNPALPASRHLYPIAMMTVHVRCVPHGTEHEELEYSQKKVQSLVPSRDIRVLRTCAQIP